MEFDKKLDKLKSFTLANVDSAADKVWNEINKTATPQNGKAKLCIIGGQPGAGKSSSEKAASNLLNGNCISINYDDYRTKHPNSKDLYNATKGENDAYSVYTNPFMKAVGDKIIEKAVAKNMNVVIEKTMNDAEGMDKLLQKFPGYEINVFISTCRQEYSKDAVKARYENAKDKYNKGISQHPPRWISDGYQKECAEGLGKTAKYVLQKYNDRINQFKVYMRIKNKDHKKARDPKMIFNYDRVKIFDNKKDQVKTLEPLINKVVYTELRDRNKSKDIDR